MGLKKGTPDLLLFFTTLFLLAIGIVMVFSASYYDTLEKDPYFYLHKQLIWAALGFVVMLMMTRIDYFRLKPYINVIFGVAFVLLIVVLFFEPIKGAQRWLDLGFCKIQPSEIMKLSMVLFLAKELSKVGPRMKNLFTGVGPFLLLLGVVGGLIMKEPDLGTTLAIAGTTFVLLIAAGLRLGHFFVLSFSGVGIVIALILADPNRINRIIGYLDPWSHASKEGYQLINSLYALGSGGLFGMGLGNSRQKLDYLPEQNTDFIYAILGEELGFIGAFLVILLFCLLAWRGYRIALACPEIFGSFLAVGITTMIVLQAFINMGVVTGLLPITGIGLPFISYGGSSLLFSMIGVGILLNISRYCANP
ncbi:MAG: putative lipid II flippase FtsW [Clostridia bacterium]|nr:putative lipid II flippase FtsW [Clostridia bacterium]MDD4665138.1 putative lipid II flippase FtsW [Clostridia bacterium]